ncbi:MAG: hypothetical protein IPL28_09015 [Chloroflexi bacterium]|nr:hypothetical protein [Chloroflexota bacterium]
MALDIWISPTPRLVPDNFRELFPSPCALYPNGFEWYKGTGIRAADHPLDGHIYFQPCDACQSEDVLVIAAQWNVSYSNGDAYWDYEVECQSCHQFSQRSYAD